MADFFPFLYFCYFLHSFAPKSTISTVALHNIMFFIWMSTCPSVLDSGNLFFLSLK